MSYTIKTAHPPATAFAPRCIPSAPQPPARRRHGPAGADDARILRAGEKPGRGRRPIKALSVDRPAAKSVIFLYQFGGPSHIDMFDMKPDAPEGIRGPHKPISSSVAGHPGLRAPAARREDHGQGHAHPEHDPHDEEPQLGVVLRR